MHFNNNTEKILKEILDEFQSQELSVLNLENLKIENKHLSLLEKTIRFTTNLRSIKLNNNLLTSNDIKHFIEDIQAN